MLPGHFEDLVFRRIKFTKGLHRTVASGLVGGVAGFLLGTTAFLAVNVLMPSSASADSLYPAGRGRYGGSAYQDSSGTYWDQNTQYGRGRYGGGSFSDDDGRTIECDTRGMCYAE